MLTPPVFVLLASLQIAAGSLNAACFQPWALLICPSLMGPLLCALASTKDESEALPKLKSLPFAFLAATLLLAPSFGYLYTSMRIPKGGAQDLARFAGRQVSLEASVESALPLRGGKNARFLCTVLHATRRIGRRFLEESCDGTTLLFINRESQWSGKLSQGSRLRCSVRVTSIRDLERNGRRGYANYLRRMGVTSLSYVVGDQHLSFVPAVSNSSSKSFGRAFGDFIESERSNLIAFHRRLLGSEIGSLLTAMVLGERAVGLDSTLLSSFRAVGLSHVLAASGFNLTIVTLSTHWLCRRLGLAALPSNFLGFAMMSVFVAFAGNSSSVVRASLMCALSIVCSSLGRRVHISGLLGAALLISLAVDPLSVADPGFQLSYLAVSGIIFILAPLSEYLKSWISNRWQRLFVECLFTVSVAQACVLPLQIFYFQQIGMLFLPANILAAMMVTPVTVAGFGSSLAVTFASCGTPLSSIFLVLASILDWLSAFPLRVLVSSVAWLASCSWAVLCAPQISAAAVFLYYFVFVLLSVRLLNYLRSKSEPFSEIQETP